MNNNDFMFDNVFVAFGEPKLPTEHLRPAHRVALADFGYHLLECSDGTLLYSFKRPGHYMLALEGYVDEVEEYFKDVGLAPYRDDPFVEKLVHAIMYCDFIEDVDLLQLVLQDLPDAVDHIDLQTYFAAPGEKRQEATWRISREDIERKDVNEPSVGWLDGLTDLDFDGRVEAAVRALLADAAPFDRAFASAFPQADLGAAALVMPDETAVPRSDPAVAKEWIERLAREFAPDMAQTHGAMPA